MSSLIIQPAIFGTNKETHFNAGGGFTIELGYLFHSVRESGLIHGFDLRADFTMGFTSGKQNVALSGGIFPIIVLGTQDATSLYGGFAMTYTLGRQLTSGRLMFDVMGYGMTYGSVDYTLEYQNFAPLSDSVSGIAIQYILPGVQYIMNNGLTVGWRNKFKLNLGQLGATGQFGFDTMVSLGYTFGSGKQPWEN